MKTVDIVCMQKIEKMQKEFDSLFFVFKINFMGQSEMKTLLLHKDLENSTKLQKNSIKKKNYFLEQLLIYGSSLAQTKSVSGKAKGWYRLPLGGGSNGKDKYLWYASGDRGIGKKFGLKNNEILVRSIRDHDDTKFDLNPGEK